jgi:hypothetical protein
MQSFEQRFEWVKRHWREYWPDGTYDELEQRFWRSLADMCASAYWSGDRVRFRLLRSYLRRAWPPHLSPAPEANWRWYPSWLRSFKFLVPRITNGKHKQSAN